MKKIRVGVIGCGGMARSHAARFDNVKDRVEIAALVDIEKERAQAVADCLSGSPRVSTDYREILPDIDAVLVILPHHLHHPVTIECLNAGKHVLVEKPMANSEQECVEMLHTAEKNKRVLMVAYCLRFNPLVVELQRLLAAKTYGDVFQLSIWTEQYTHYHAGHWANSATTLGGGQFFSHGCHYVDLMLWMLGRPVRGVHMGTRKGTPWMEGEGTSMASIEFENGVLGYHGATWGARGTRMGGGAFHAHCTEGMLEVDLRAGKLFAHTNENAHEPGRHAYHEPAVLMDRPSQKHTEEEMRHFIDCIQSGKKPLTDPISSIEGLRVVWEMYHAQEKNQIADLRGFGLGTFKP